MSSLDELALEEAVADAVQKMRDIEAQITALDSDWHPIQAKIHEHLEKLSVLRRSGRQGPGYNKECRAIGNALYDLQSSPECLERERLVSDLFDARVEHSERRKRLEQFQKKRSAGEACRHRSVALPFPPPFLTCLPCLPDCREGCFSRSRV